MFGAQLGKTEAGNNWIGYVIDKVPGPMMAVLPTVELAKRSSRQRIDPLVQECPALRAKVKDKRSRDSGNTVLSKEFPGGILVLTGANSAVGLRSMPARFLFLDECDAYPTDADEEGDPIELAIARTTTFSRRKVLLTSTPKFTGLSRIEAAYEDSDKRQYAVPCPHCREFQILQFSQLRWPKKKPQFAIYKCEHCEKAIENHHKQWMLPRGEWRPSATGNGRTAGFQLSALYSPVGWLSWPEIAEKWEKIHGNPTKRQAFVNTILGEPWKISGEAPDWQRLYERREQYATGIVPRGAMLLTAGVDVQKDRLEIQVVGWGPGKESWMVDYVVLPGDTSRPKVWADLTEFIDRTYEHVCGPTVPIAKVGVDSGYATQEVYAWSRTQAPGRVLVLNPQQNGVVPVGQPQAVDVNFLGKKIKRGAKVWPVAVGLLKRELYGWLKLERPTTESGESYPPGYCHFPQMDDEFFQQLTAEQQQAKVVKGYRRLEWVKTRERNEALDTRVYARAAAIVAGLDRLRDEQWAAIKENLGIRDDQPPEAEPENAAVAQEAVTVPAARPSAPPAPQNRDRQQDWLDRDRTRGWLKR